MKIKNTSRHIVVFILEHNVVCSEGKCGCGERTVRGTTRVIRVPGSLTLCAGETVEVPAAVAELRHVKAAERRGEVVVIREEDPPVEVASVEEISAETQEPSGDKRQVRTKGSRK